jgi:hypothetical protein
MDRPLLNDKISTQDFQEHYWLKEELSVFCKVCGIDRTGGKAELANRIMLFLESGGVVSTKVKPNKTSTSKFNWSKEVLTGETTITDNYKNSENVRLFFLREISPHFHFNVEFMKWAKHNTGKTLQEAIKEWGRLFELKKDKNYHTIIEPQFEYNKYMRAFLADNHGKSIKEAIRFWKLKSAQRGTNEYERSDLDLT